MESWHRTFLFLFVVLLSYISPASADYYYYNTWYIYVIVVFVVIAISSCVGACVRHRRQQQILAHQQSLMAQVAIQNAGNTNHTYMASSSMLYAPNAYQYPAYAAPPADPLQPPVYTVKDTSKPPEYDEAIGSGYNQGYPGQQASQSAAYPPFPTQAPPYPTQAPPYPTQAPPYPTQTPAYPSLAPPQPFQIPTHPTQTSSDQP